MQGEANQGERHTAMSSHLLRIVYKEMISDFASYNAQWMDQATKIYFSLN